MIHYTKRPAHIGDIWTDIAKVQAASGVVSADEQLRCIDKANNSALAKQIDAKINDFIATWHPTGIYTGAQIVKLMDALQQATNAARSELFKVPQNSYGLVSARNYLDINDARIVRYRSTVVASGGKKISAPELKTEYVKSLVNVWNAYTTVSAIDCAMTWGQRADAAISRAIDAAKSVLGTIIDTVESVVKAVKAPFDILAWLGKYPVIPVGIGAMVLYFYVKKKWA